MQNYTAFPPISHDPAFLTLQNLYSMLKHQNVQYIELVQHYEKARRVYSQTMQQMHLNIGYYQHAACEKENMCHHLIQELETLRKKNEELCKLPKEYQMMKNILKSQEDQLHQLENENLQKADTIKEYREANFRLQRKNQQYGGSIRHRDQLENQMTRNQRQTNHVSHRTKEMLSLEQSIQTLKEHLSKQEAKHVAEMATKESTIEQMREEITSLRGKQSSISEMERLRQKARESEAALVNQSKCTEELIKRERQLVAVNKSQLEALQQLKGDLQKKEELQRKLVSENIEFKKQLGQVSRALAKDNDDKLHEPDLLFQLDQERAHKSKLQKQIEKLKAEYGEIQTKLSQTLVQMEKMLETNESKDKMVQELMMNKQTYEQQSIAHRETVKRLVSDIAQKDNLQAQLVNANDRLKQKLQDEIDQRTSIKLRAQVHEQNDKQSDKELNQQIEHEKEKLKRERAQRMHLEKQLEQLKDELEKMTKHSQQTIDQLAEALKRKETNAKQQQDLMRKNKEYQQEVAVYQETVKRLEKEIANKNSAENLLANENLQLKQKLQEDMQIRIAAREDQEKRQQLDKELVQQLELERRERAMVEKQLEQFKRDCDQLVKEQRHAKVKIEELSQRLATEMNEKLSRDERNLENVSIASRPMNIATEYQNLCTTEWLDAKTAVDETMLDTSDVKRLEFLCGIFPIGLKQSTSNFQILLAQLQDLVIKPFEAEDEQRDIADVIQRHKQTTEKMESAFIDLLRINADKTNISSVAKSVTRAIALQWPIYNKLLKIERVQIFIDAVTRLTWKMALQKPPMAFSQAGLGEPWQGEQLQTPHYGSSDPNSPRSKVIGYVHPILLHGKAVMAKGTVLLKQ